jgi:hypothetical protein
MKYSLPHDPWLESRLDVPALHATIIFRPPLAWDQWAEIPKYLDGVNTQAGLRISLGFLAANWGIEVGVRPIAEYPPPNEP